MGYGTSEPKEQRKGFTIIIIITYIIDHEKEDRTWYLL